MNEQEHTPEERRRVALEMSAKILAPLVASILLVTATAGVLLYAELAGRASENRRLIEQIKDARNETEIERARTRARFKRTDVLVCREIEALKTGFRERADQAYAELPRTARLLNAPLTPELRQAAREARDALLARYAPREGGCGTLPSLRPTDN